MMMKGGGNIVSPSLLITLMHIENLFLMQEKIHIDALHSGGQGRRRELQNYLRRCEDAVLASVETWEPRLEQDLFGIY